MTEEVDEKFESDTEEVDDTAIWSSLIGNIVAVIMATFFYFQSKECKDSCPQKHNAPKRYNPESFANALNDLKKMAETLKRQECACAGKKSKVKKQENPSTPSCNCSSSSQNERKMEKDMRPLENVYATAPLINDDGNILEAHKPKNSNLSLLCDQSTTTPNYNYNRFVDCGVCGDTDSSYAQCDVCCHKKCESCCQTVQDNEDFSDYQIYNEDEAPPDMYEEDDEVCLPCEECNPCGQKKLNCVSAEICTKSSNARPPDVEEACMVSYEPEPQTKSAPEPKIVQESCTYDPEQEEKKAPPPKSFKFCPRQQETCAEACPNKRVDTEEEDDDDEDAEYFDETPRKLIEPCITQTCPQRYQKMQRRQNNKMRAPCDNTSATGQSYYSETPNYSLASKYPNPSQSIGPRNATGKKMPACPIANCGNTTSASDFLKQTPQRNVKIPPTCNSEKAPPKKMVATASGNSYVQKSPIRIKISPITSSNCPAGKNKLVSLPPPQESKPFPNAPNPSRKQICRENCPSYQTVYPSEHNMPTQKQYIYTEMPPHQPRFVRQIVKTTTRIPAQYDDDSDVKKRTIIRKTSKQLMYDNDYIEMEEQANYTVYAAPSNTSRNKMPGMQSFKRLPEKRPFGCEGPQACTSKATCRPSTSGSTPKRSQSSFQYMPNGAIAISSSRNTLGVEKAKPNLYKYGVSEQEENYLKQKQKRSSMG